MEIRSGNFNSFFMHCGQSNFPDSKSSLKVSSGGKRKRDSVCVSH